MNFGGSFFGSFPTAGALSRTVLQDATGGNTQLVGLFSSVIVIFVILLLGSLFGPLPSAALAAIVVVALKGLYFQLRDIYKFYKLSLQDMLIWLVVFFSTLLIGLDIGLGIGVLFSLVLVMFRTVLPYSPALGEPSLLHHTNPVHTSFAEPKDKLAHMTPTLFHVTLITLYSYRGQTKMGTETADVIEPTTETCTLLSVLA
jgi:MFS superfamily sulfate permease-like transporter